ncbi:hypothetical protein CCZ01_00495 [Helicobacter monodelphidis]|nr:hypothetical protein CCZ01_00495 [Helicobacter sp. 15-1451]
MTQHIVAFDLGLKRIGVAFCYQNICVPLEPILRINRHQAAQECRKVLEQKKAELLVLGISLDSSSTDENQRRCEHFVSLLKISIPVVYVDEWGSSKEVAVGFKDKRDGKLDSLAALVILERFLLNHTKI